MRRRVRISAGEVSLAAYLNRSATADALWEALPLEGGANVWGDEIYFAIPVEIEEAGDARRVMEVGELGYWPVGQAFCIFFGPTPVSDGSEPKAYSKVNPFGMIEGDATLFKAIRGGERIVVDRFEE